jgi:hypothetical protein
VDISLKGATALISPGRSEPLQFPGIDSPMLDEGIYAERAIKAGARDYIMKSESIER